MLGDEAVASGPAVAHDDQFFVKSSEYSKFRLEGGTRVLHHKDCITVGLVNGEASKF